jgi:hypothetical protein
MRALGESLLCAAMEGKRSGIPFTPLGVGQVVDRAARLYAGNARRIWLIVLPFALATQLIFLVLSFSALPSGTEVVNGKLLVPFGSTASGLNIAIVVQAALNYLIVVQIVNGASLRLYSGAYFGEDLTTSQVLRFTIRKLPALLLLGLIYGLVLVIGFLFIIVPGIYLYVALCVVAPVLIVEGKGGFNALGRSQELVRGRWWPTCAALLLGLVVVLGGGFGLGAVVGAIESSGSTSPSAYLLVTALSNLIEQVLLSPITAALVITIYFDLRVRKEGLDLELLASRLGIGSPDASEADEPLQNDGGSLA